MPYPTYLMHHGVKGQKWGERRYQYENGSLTPEGREHYGIGEKDAKKLQKLASKLYGPRNRYRIKGVTNFQIGRSKNYNKNFINKMKEIDKKTGNHIHNLNKKYNDVNPYDVDTMSIEKQKKYLKDLEKTLDDILGDYADLKVSAVSSNKESYYMTLKEAMAKRIAYI